MQSRTFLRIEGDLVSLITEVIDREVTLPDLLAELTTAQVAITPRLPTGCRFWIRSGTTDRSGLRRRAGPVAADDRVPRQPTSRQRADHLSARPAVRRLRRLDDRRTDRGAVHVLPDAADRVARRDALLARPCRTRTTMGSSVSDRSG